MEELYEVSISPHIHDEDSVNKIMWTVVIALIPVFIAALVFFGHDALRLVSVSVVVCVFSEYMIRKIRKRDTTIHDGSAVITGMLLAFCVPPTVPSWMMALGAFLAIALGKEIFGGLGMNVFNPALVARAILLAAFPAAMTQWTHPEGMTHATVLGMVKEGALENLPAYSELFIGRIGGSLGETSALAILVGGLFLAIRKVIRIEVPLLYIGSVFFLAAFLGRDPVVEILSGGLMLGAFFMITDMVTTPVTVKGGIFFACGCGLITSAIRTWGGYPEGVCYSILIMNAFTPLIDRCTAPRRLGYQSGKRKKENT
jgi:Na+-translocating ferredoxin:NAD+ oxidoreductase subunit D